MIKLNDLEKLNKFIAKHDMVEIFSEDMKSYMELWLFKRNEYLCKEGQDMDYLIFFVEGKAKVYITLSNGKSLLLCFYHDFEVLGDVELLDSKTALCNVQAIEDTYCIGIPLRKLRTHLLNDVRFLRYICSTLGERLDRCSKNSSINLLYPLENRLASYILATGESVNISGERIIKFNERLTEISELLGTSYRHLLRTLNTLCANGVLKRKNDYFEVINETELKKLAADLYK